MGGPQGRSGQVRKISPQPEFDPRTVQLVASRYTDWAIPAHHDKVLWLLNDLRKGFGRARHRWKFENKVGFYEIEYEDAGWINLL